MKQAGRNGAAQRCGEVAPRPSGAAPEAEDIHWSQKPGGAVGGSHEVARRRCRRLPALACCALLLGVPPAAAGDRAEAKGTTNGSSTATPNVSEFLAAPLRSQLSFAFRLAQHRIRNNPRCSALFTRLGANGLQLLASIRFEEATSDRIRGTCMQKRAAAYTQVGGRQISLCPGFGVISGPDAALILIHEVLHDAGMSEKPADPNGLTSQEINDLVGASCSR